MSELVESLRTYARAVGLQHGRDPTEHVAWHGADRIEALEHENARLRSALHYIAHKPNCSRTEMRDTAIAALAERAEEGTDERAR